MLLQPGICPRHKLRVYSHSFDFSPSGSEYKRLLNFLSRSVAQAERSILDFKPVPDFAQVKSLITRPHANQSVSASLPFDQPRNLPNGAIAWNRQALTPPPPAIESAAALQPPTQSDDRSPRTQPQGAAGADLESQPENQATVPQSKLQPAPCEAGEDSDRTPDFAIAQEASVELEELTVHDAPHEARFIAHLSELLNEWFSQENANPPDDEPESDEMRLLDKHMQARKVLAKFSETIRDSGEDDATLSKANEKCLDPTHEKCIKATSAQALKDIVSLQSQNGKKQWPERIRLKDGSRRELFQNGSIIQKDAIGRVRHVQSQDGVKISFAYDQKGHLQQFVRTDASGKIDSHGERDKHGVVVRDCNGRVRAQGDSMSVDANGCLSIRKFDGQFWTLDVVRGIHVERRILEDSDGGWRCLTAVLTCDGFRMVTRFQKLKENTRKGYRRFGDWLHGGKGSTLRFYGRDGSVIQFEHDDDLLSLKPSCIWPPGSRKVEKEWRGNKCPVGRQAGTAWESVHQYISQYLAAL